MAVRGSAVRRVPGNPLGGLLRDVQRQSRVAQRPKPGPPDPPGPVVVHVPAPPTTAVGAGGGTAAAVVVTDADGRAVWAYPTPYPGVPVVGALPVAATAPLTVTVEEVTAARLVVRVWHPASSEPAGGGVRVHVTATPPDGR